jgi:hypothetical protein
VIVQLHYQICRGLTLTREPTTPPDCALIDTKGVYWVAYDTQAGVRVWSPGPTLREASESALKAFRDKHGTDVLIKQETRIAPDGSFSFEALPFVPNGVAR